MPLATADIELIRDLVAQRSGNRLSTEQGYLMETRLQPVAERAGLPNVERLVAELRRSKSATLHDSVSEALTINETSFFRDQHPFDALRERILPKLIESRRASKQLSIWCAASSCGQEPYSIAMLLKEHFPQLADWNVRILATDLSDEMLRKSADGIYNQFEVNRGLPAKLLMKFFDRSGAHWQLKPDVRRMVEFRKLNLTHPWHMSSCDVVFLRNVLIYFDATTKAGILERVHRVLRPDGFLFLGGGEAILNPKLPFRREEIVKTVCYRPL